MQNNPTMILIVVVEYFNSLYWAFKKPTPDHELVKYSYDEHFILRICSLADFSLRNFCWFYRHSINFKVIIWLIKIFKQNQSSFRIQTHYRENKLRMNLIHIFFVDILSLSNWSMINASWTMSFIFLDRWLISLVALR